MRWPKFHEWRLPGDEPWLCFHRTPRGYRLRFPDLADFTVSASGRHVRCVPVPGTTRPTLEHLHLNQVLPLALSRQGRMMFHASVIETDAGAVAFVGESGRGKSTLAAAFAAAGHRFLTDDSVQFHCDGSRCMAQPGHASIRLWEDSHDALVPPNVRLADPVQHTSKARVLAGGAFTHCSQPLPLRRIYVLGTGAGNSPTFTPIRPADALIELVKHSFLLDIEHRDLLARHFDELARIAAFPIHYHLDYPRRYDDLHDVRRAILDHSHNDDPAA